MTLRVLVAGGCHVAGYPIGEEHSFVHVLEHGLASQGVLVESKSVAYLPVTHVDRATEAVRSFTPDVTILQLGNYETTVTFRQFFRRKLGMKKQKSSSGKVHLPPESQFHSPRMWRIKCIGKLWLDRMLGHCMVDVRELECATRTLLVALERAGARNIIVLSPLPCADPLYMAYRTELSSVFRRLARERGHQFLDCLDFAVRGETLFGDATHLNRRGQELIGQTIGSALSLLAQYIGSQQLSSIR